MSGQEEIHQSGKCKHGKPMYTEADLVAWERRPCCVARGNCECSVCSQVCWDESCKRAAAAQIPGAHP